MDMYNKECFMVILMLHRKQYRVNAQITDDNDDATQAPISFTTKNNYDAEEINDNAHVDDNSEENIPYLPVPQLDFDVGFQLDELFESCIWYTFLCDKITQKWYARAWIWGWPHSHY